MPAAQSVLFASGPKSESESESKSASESASESESESAIPTGDRGQTPVFSKLFDLATLTGRLVEITSQTVTSQTVASNASGDFGRRAGSAAKATVPSIWDMAPPRDVGSAALTVATGLVWQAQQLGQPTAWIGARASSFYPPDLDAGGIDLAALVVVRAAGASSAARAADKLLRSGAFGLVVLDLGAHAVVPSPLLSRLLGLAQKHHAAVVFLTEKSAEAPSLAPLVSLRVSTSRRRVGSERFACTIEATKDKRRAPGWTLEETFRGPPGLR